MIFKKTRYFKNSGLISLFKLLKQGLYYLRVIVAPASSSLALISSASAAATPSLTLAGAPSTRPLAYLSY
ncbi:hypothetical protein [Streptococcus pyogenes]